ncbi:MULTISPECIES: hypothetical protein [unclassified Microcoleus]|uniref:hypothetical protein n=1 Tax=unclassified Microcoleus TaxID=2642155 RepID=UPI002FCF2199
MCLKVLISEASIVGTDGKIIRPDVYGLIADIWFVNLQPMIVSVKKVFPFDGSVSLVRFEPEGYAVSEEFGINSEGQPVQLGASPPGAFQWERGTIQQPSSRLDGWKLRENLVRKIGIKAVPRKKGVKAVRRSNALTGLSETIYPFYSDNRNNQFVASIEIYSV